MPSTSAAEAAKSALEAPKTPAETVDVSLRSNQIEFNFLVKTDYAEAVKTAVAEVVKAAVEASKSVLEAPKDLVEVAKTETTSVVAKLANVEEETTKLAKMLTKVEKETTKIAKMESNIAKLDGEDGVRITTLVPFFNFFVFPHLSMN
ncbi:uncharacterized protein LOC122662881 [Telopea speciosissima]|uniref:uncharacterized protein LOC122662881 n=1 Tax=Telopea speciosissima TaxID=54955 RepID=UPI001CC7B4DE|nr:uncharacterized protein LOC122662881 [Telopea speciosissima]